MNLFGQVAPELFKKQSNFNKHLNGFVPHCKSLDKTPYQITHNEKLNISHLQEFSSLVWILLQGQDKPPKLQPHSKAQIFVGYDNGSKSVLYYNTETRKVLTSCNFHFLNLPEHQTSLKQLSFVYCFEWGGDERWGKCEKWLRWSCENQ